MSHERHVRAVPLGSAGGWNAAGAEVPCIPVMLAGPPLTQCVKIPLDRDYALRYIVVHERSPPNRPLPQPEALRGPRASIRDPRRPREGRLRGRSRGSRRRGHGRGHHGEDPLPRPRVRAHARRRLGRHADPAAPRGQRGGRNRRGSGRARRRHPRGGAAPPRLAPRASRPDSWPRSPAGSRTPARTSRRSSGGSSRRAGSPGKRGRACATTSASSSARASPTSSAAFATSRAGCLRAPSPASPRRSAISRRASPSSSPSQRGLFLRSPRNEPSPRRAAASSRNHPGNTRPKKRRTV